LFDAKEKAAIEFADRITRAATTICDDDLEKLRKHFSEEQIVELALTVCVANFTNRFNDTFLCEPDLG
jgi:alkylhydroperoxidase family enzyme